MYTGIYVERTSSYSPILTSEGSKVGRVVFFTLAIFARCVRIIHFLQSLKGKGFSIFSSRCLSFERIVYIVKIPVLDYKIVHNPNQSATFCSTTSGNVGFTKGNNYLSMHSGIKSPCYCCVSLLFLPECIAHTEEDKVDPK